MRLDKTCNSRLRVTAILIAPHQLCAGSNFDENFCYSQQYPGVQLRRHRGWNPLQIHERVGELLTMNIRQK
jgi:hypothetical protein